MANLRTPVETISLAMKVRSEGLGLREGQGFSGKTAY